MNNLDLDALEIFRTVAVEGSVSAAAEKLHRVQSNISTRIKQLESRLETQLFLRHSRGLTLSSEGKVLLSYADRLLQLSEEAEAALRDGRPRGVFRIGTMESTAAARLPAVLSRFHREYPQVEIVLLADTTDALVERLRQFEIDAAFVAEPVAAHELHSAVAFEEELVLLTPADHPPVVDAADVSEQTVIAFRAGCAYRRYLEDWLMQARIRPKSVMEVSSYHAIIACVAAGTGVAVVPRSVLAVVPQPEAVRLPEPLARINTLLIWRKEGRSAKQQALLNLLEEASLRPRGEAA